MNNKGAGGQGSRSRGPRPALRFGAALCAASIFTGPWSLTPGLALLIADTVSVEWIFGIVASIIGGLLGLVWLLHSRRIDDAAEAAETKAAEVNRRLDEKCQALNGRIDEKACASEKRAADVWAAINELKKEDSTIKATLGAITADIKNIEKRLDALPTTKDFLSMFKDSEDRIEARTERSMERLVAAARGEK